MPTPIDVIGRWNGKAKSWVREHKAEILAAASRENFHYLGFPGDTAAMERLLVDQGLLQWEDVVGIQRGRPFNNYDGRDVLRHLMQQTSDAPFALYVGDFTQFTQQFGPQYYPELRQRERQLGLGDSRSFARWMFERGNVQFSACDIDLCCPFYRPNAQAICSLFSTNRLSRRGVLFITHMKGREKPADRAYLNTTARGNKFWYGEVPAFYMHTASLLGYALKLKEVVEYCEEHPATPMLQYIFTFQRTNPERCQRILDAQRTIISDELLPAADESIDYNEYESDRFIKYYI